MIYSLSYQDFTVFFARGKQSRGVNCDFWTQRVTVINFVIDIPVVKKEVEEKKEPEPREDQEKKKEEGKYPERDTLSLCNFKWKSYLQKSVKCYWKSVQSLSFVVAFSGYSSGFVMIIPHNSFITKASYLLWWVFVDLNKDFSEVTQSLCFCLIPVIILVM